MLSLRSVEEVLLDALCDRLDLLALSSPLDTAAAVGTDRDLVLMDDLFSSWPLPLGQSLRVLFLLDGSLATFRARRRVDRSSSVVAVADDDDKPPLHKEPGFSSTGCLRRVAVFVLLVSGP